MECSHGRTCRYSIVFEFIVSNILAKMVSLKLSLFFPLTSLTNHLLCVLLVICGIPIVFVIYVNNLQFFQMAVFAFPFCIHQEQMIQMRKQLFFIPIYAKEREDEKGRPIISVEAILLSVQNMLSDPNENSPANLEAAVVVLIFDQKQRQWKSDRKAFRKSVRQTVELSLENSCVCS